MTVKKNLKEAMALQEAEEANLQEFGWWVSLAIEHIVKNPEEAMAGLKGEHKEIDTSDVYELTQLMRGSSWLDIEGSLERLGTPEGDAELEQQVRAHVAKEWDVTAPAWDKPLSAYFASMAEAEQAIQEMTEMGLSESWDSWAEGDKEEDEDEDDEDEGGENDEEEPKGSLAG